MLTLQRSDTGVQIVVTVTDDQTGNAMNLAGADNIQFIFKPPGQAAYTVAGSKYDDGSDGKVAYMSSVTDFTIRGVWKMQVYYSLSGNARYTRWCSFEVLPNLQDLS